MLVEVAGIEPDYLILYAFWLWKDKVKFKIHYTT